MREIILQKRQTQHIIANIPTKIKYLLLTPHLPPLPLILPQPAFLSIKVNIMTLAPIIIAFQATCRRAFLDPGAFIAVEVARLGSIVWGARSAEPPLPAISDVPIEAETLLNRVAVLLAQSAMVVISVTVAIAQVVRGAVAIMEEAGVVGGEGVGEREAVCHVCFCDVADAGPDEGCV